MLKLQPPVRFSRDQASASGRDGTAPTSEQASSSSAARLHVDSVACKVIWRGDKSRNRNVCKLDLSATLILILDVTVEPEDWQYLGRQVFAMATITYVTELRRLMSRDVIPFFKFKDRDAAFDPTSVQDPPVVCPYIKMIGESQAPSLCLHSKWHTDQTCLSRTNSWVLWMTSYAAACMLQALAQ